MEELFKDNIVIATDRGLTVEQLIDQENDFIKLLIQVYEKHFKVFVEGIVQIVTREDDSLPMLRYYFKITDLQEKILFYSNVNYCFNESEVTVKHLLEYLWMGRKRLFTDLLLVDDSECEQFKIISIESLKRKYLK